MNGDQECVCAAPEPADGCAAAMVADELLVHALLVFVLLREGSSHERRVRNAVSVGAGSSSARVHARGRVGRGFRRIGGVLAVLAVGGACWYAWMRSEPRAYALVRAAARAAGNARYEVRAMRPPAVRLEDEAFCIVDSRAPGLVLIRATMPGGRRVIVGRDEDGAWALRIDGGVTRNGAGVAWPRWSGYGESALPADSVDRVLEDLASHYRLERGAHASQTGPPGTVFEHVMGVRAGTGGPGASRVDLWIDPRSSVLERMELHWADADLAEASARGEAPPGQHPPPASLLVFERVEAPEFPEEWFSPGAHAGQP